MILDTNALSALAASNKSLVQKLAPATRIAVTLISLGEYEFGILGSSYRSELKTWLDALLLKCDVLLPNRDTLFYYAAIRNQLKVAGKPIPANDVWIAALVRQHNMPLLSKDRHFDSVAGVQRIDW
jgi:predicted nucleic acid-binding protein